LAKAIAETYSEASEDNAQLIGSKPNHCLIKNRHAFQSSAELCVSTEFSFPNCISPEGLPLASRLLISSSDLRLNLHVGTELVFLHRRKYRSCIITAEQKK